MKRGAVRGMRALGAALLLVGVAAGCGDSTGPGQDRGTVTADLNGSPFVANLDIQAFYNNGVLIIGALDQVSRRVSLSIRATAPGTYTLGPGKSDTGTVWLGVFPYVSTGVGGGGTVTITTLTANRATGTFAFTAKATDSNLEVQLVTVTNGTFDVKY